MTEAESTITHEDVMRIHANELRSIETRRKFLSGLMCDETASVYPTITGLSERDLMALAIHCLATEVVGLSILVEQQNAKALAGYDAIAKVAGATWAGIMGIPAPGYAIDPTVDDAERDICARSYFAGITIREAAGIDGAGR